jgi:hypothetical protein
VVQYRKLLPVQFRTTRHFSFHQRHSETGWHNITCSGPNVIPRKLCLHICRWILPQPNGTRFTNVNVEVKNKMKHLYNIIKHATTSQASWSLLNFLLYSERQQASAFCRWSADHYYLSTSRGIVQFKKWSNLRGIPLHYFIWPISFATFCLLACLINRVTQRPSQKIFFFSKASSLLFNGYRNS